MAKQTLICVDKDMSYNVEGIAIGLEEILIVTTEVEMWVYKVPRHPQIHLIYTSRDSFAERTERYIGVLLTK